MVELKKKKETRIEQLYDLHRQQWFQNQLQTEKDEAEERAEESEAKKLIKAEEEQEVVDEQHLAMREVELQLHEICEKFQQIKQTTTQTEIKLLAMEGLEAYAVASKTSAQVETSLPAPSLSVSTNASTNASPEKSKPTTSPAPTHISANSSKITFEASSSNGSNNPAPAPTEVTNLDEEKREIESETQGVSHTIESGGNVGIGNTMSSLISGVSILIMPKRGGTKCAGDCNKKYYKKDLNKDGFCPDCEARRHLPDGQDTQ